VVAQFAGSCRVEQASSSGWPSWGWLEDVVVTASRACTVMNKEAAVVYQARSELG
jgi:hypothetical protein